MPLLQSLATIILGVLVMYFILVNILEIPFTKDLIKSDGNIKKKLDKNSLAVLDSVEEENVSLNDLEETLRKDLSRNEPEKVTNRLPDPLVQQVKINEPHPINVEPSNATLYEKDAEFGSDRTNIAQFVSSNPTAFYGDLRHDAYVPDVNSWNQQGSQMYNDLVQSRPNQTLQPANFENCYSQLGMGN